MNQLVEKAAQMGASDIHLTCGLPVRFRIHGELQTVGETPLTHAVLEQYAMELAGALPEQEDIDLSATFAGIRIRANLFRQQGHVSLALRLLSDTIPPLERLGLPPEVEKLTRLRRGLVLVVGATGSGKSTTLAALLDRINESRRSHILTLEDPIEYLHAPKQATVSQREVGRDTGSFAKGLRSALREDPDVILIGEMRDLETIETALTAAETGHLVFATLHTNSAASTIDRVVDCFPADRHRQIRTQLSMCLEAVLSQQLLPRADGSGRVLACEMMMVNTAIRSMIREGKTPQISNAMATSAKEGSVLMDTSLQRLPQARQITREIAVEYSQAPDQLRRIL